MRRTTGKVCGVVVCALVLLTFTASWRHGMPPAVGEAARADNKPSTAVVPAPPPLVESPVRPHVPQDNIAAEEAKRALEKAASLANAPIAPADGDDPTPHGPGPVNNNCANAQFIGTGTFSFTTVGATTDGPVLQSGCDTATNCFNDVWFNFPSPCSGTLTVTTCNTASFDTVVVIYNTSTPSCPCPVTPVQQIGCDDDTAGCANATSTATASVTAGQCCKIRIGAFDSLTTGSGSFTVTCGAAPTGACCQGTGSCADTSQSACTTGTFLGVGTSCGAPSPPNSCSGACCQANGLCDDTLSLNACGAISGAKLFFFSTHCVDSPCPATVSNDSPDSAAPLGAPPTSANANTAMASDDEITPCGSGVGLPNSSVWYYIAGTGHTMTASTCNPGTTFDTQVEVFCGSPSNLLCINGNDDATGSPPECALNGVNRKSRVSWCSTVGSQYFISVSGFGTAFGTFELTVTDDGLPCTTPIVCPPSTGISCDVGCLGDMNHDLVLNGLDVTGFARCVIAGGGAGCECANLNGDGAVNTGDIPSFVNAALAGTTQCFNNRLMEFNTLATVRIQMDNPPLGLITLNFAPAGEADTQVRLQRGPYFPGQIVPTEMRQLELVATNPTLGIVRLHLSNAPFSFGSVNIQQVDINGDPTLADHFFDVFFALDIQLPNHVTAFNPVPLHLTSFASTQMVPNIPMTSSQPVPLTFSNPTFSGTVVDVTHEVRKECIYIVSCIDGPCNDCPVRLGDKVACFYCVDTCAGFQRKCGTRNCCVKYTVIDCRIPNEPPCPPGDFCPTCNPQTGKCCLGDRSCIVTTESNCKDQAGPNGYKGDGTTCAPPQRCCFANGDCKDIDPQCCADSGGVTAGGTCQPKQRCCIGSNCTDMDPICCTQLGGTSLGGQCLPPQKCCINGGCTNMDPQCCVNQGGLPFAGQCLPQKCCLAGGLCVMADQDCCQVVLGGTSFPGACAPQKCCLAGGFCQDLDPQCCQLIGGTTFPGLCSPQRCCFPNGLCLNLDPACCQMIGGVSLPGVCGSQRCCFADGTCQNLDPSCCNLAGGTPAGGLCAAQQACCFGNQTCAMRDPGCCVSAGGQAQGAGTTCTPVNPCCNCTNVTVTMSSLFRVSPTKTAQITVTVNPATTCDVNLVCVRIAGTAGSATVAPAVIHATTVVTITGGDQTNVGGGENVALQASINGTVCTQEAFCVCAHPNNFVQTVGNDSGAGKLHFEYTWGSDSGALADLNAVQIGEHVAYPNAGQPPDPPFHWGPFAAPTVINLAATAGTFQDNHSNNGAGETMLAGTAAQYTGTQNYRFRCSRCPLPGSSNDPNVLNWGEILSGPISIDRFIELNAGNWRYRIVKSGVTATRGPLPITGP